MQMLSKHRNALTGQK